MKLFRNLIVGAALLASAAVADAQNGTRQTPNGFCTLSSMAASTLLSTCSGGIPANTTYAVICAYAQGVVWRDDPSMTAPTATPGSGGQGIAAGSCIPYNGTFTAIRFIQQTGGAILGVTFYR